MGSLYQVSKSFTFLLLAVVVCAVEAQRGGYFARRANYNPLYFSGDLNRYYPNYYQNPYFYNQNSRQGMGGATPQGNRAPSQQGIGQGTRATQQGTGQGMRGAQPQGMGQGTRAAQQGMAQGAAAGGQGATPGRRPRPRRRFVAPGQRLLG